MSLFLQDHVEDRNTDARTGGTDLGRLLKSVTGKVTKAREPELRASL